MKRISVAIAFLLAWYAGIHAKEQYIFTQISIEEGLTSTINCIFKEKNGEVWLGTPEGLFRFIAPLRQRSARRMQGIQDQYRHEW